MNRQIRWNFSIIVVYAIFAISLMPGITDCQPLKRVLILNSYHPGFSWSEDEEAGVVERLHEKIPSIETLVEYLDAKRYPEKSHLVRMKNFLVGKYGGKEINLIIALDDAAVDMLTTYHTALFPDVPIVFAGITDFKKYADRGRNRITGILEFQDIKRTMDTIVRLHPEASEIFSICDMTISGMSARRNIEAISSDYYGSVKIRFLPECTFDEARTIVNTLPLDSIVLLNTYTSDKLGKALSTKDSTHMIVSAANVPVYGVHQNRFGQGIIGGYLLNGRKHGNRAADMGCRILFGEDPDAIPIQKNGSSLPMFDYKQLKRFGISPSKLPGGSFVINQPESVFTTHRKFATTITIILILLVIVVLFLAFFIVRLSQAKATLRKKTDELDHFFGLSLDLLCIASLDGRLIRLNPAWESSLGYTLDDLEGKMLSDLVHSDDIAAVRNSVADLMAGKTIIDFTTRCRCKNGIFRWIEWRLAPYRDSLIYGAARDITTRKLAEISLRESEAKMRSILDNAGIGVAMISPDKKVLEFNRRMREWFPEINSNHLPVCCQAFNDPLREMKCNGCPVHKTLQDGMVHEATTSAFRTGGGRKYRLVASPIFDQSGRVMGVIEIIEDITERLSLELQLRQAQKMESIGRLAGGVAHDFNNMLGVILGYGELLLGQVSPDQPMHSALQEIMKAAQRSADITRHLLAFARKQTISPKVIDMNTTVAGMTTMLQRLIGEDIELAWGPGEAVWSVLIDPGQIDQIMVNLCINARDAISDVGRITIETSNVDFDEIYCKDHLGFLPGEYVLLAVSDNGCGMSAEIMDTIFDPFFSTKESGKGTGLGLATVYGIVKQNSGFINVYSEPGRGTTFKIYFQRHRIKEDIVSEKEKEHSVVRGHETILLVEDEPAILEMTTVMLQTLGYTVLAAGVPAEAIRIAKEHKGEIQLLMTDVIMPEMNGRDLAKNVLDIHPDSNRLFMSGYTADVIAHHGVLDEGVHFLQKPFSMVQLGAKVREALDGDKA